MAAPTIRLLGPTDMAVLDRVALDLFDEAIDASLLREMLGDARHHLIVAIDDRVVIGFVSGVHYVHPDKPAQLFVNEVATAEQFRRQGIARAMLDAMVAHARTLGCTEAWVLTERTNQAAMALYRRRADEPTDAVMFTIPLDPA